MTPRRALVGVSSGLVVSLVSGFLVATPLAAAPPRAAEASAGLQRSVPVGAAAVRKPLVAQSDRDRWSPSAVVWPSPGVSLVDVPAAAAPVARVGGTPIWVGASRSAAARVGASTPSRVRVEVLDRAATSRLRVDGVVLRVARDDAVSARGPVSLEVDYSGFAGAFGGDWAGRLTLVRLPSCVLSTPDVAACQRRSPVLTARNDRVARRLLADVDLAAPAQASGGLSAADEPASSVFAVTGGVSSETGDFSKTTLGPSMSWQAGTSAGDFTTSYPLRVPPAPGGLAPEVAFRYSSGAVDGQTNGANVQPSWLGEGWNYEPGYVERSYRSCIDDFNPHASLGTGWNIFDRFPPLADYDNDGKKDIIGVAGGDMWFYRNTSTAGEPAIGAQFLSTGWGSVGLFVGAVDFDGDGKTDLIGRAGGDMYVWRGTGTAGAPAFGAGTFFGSGWNIFDRMLPVADYNNDGKPDIVGVGGGDMWFYKNTSTPGSASIAGQFVSSGWGAVGSFVGGGDFDGDGKTDIVGRASSDMYVWRGTGTVAAPAFGAGTFFGSGWTIFDRLLPLVDYDGDGKRDIAAVAGSDLWIYLNTSTVGSPSIAGQFVSGGWSSIGTFVGAADFDTDGKTDLVGRHSSGEMITWRGVGSVGQPILGTYYTNATSDLCWRQPNATLVWGGRATELVRDDASGTWRLANDDGSRLEALAGTGNYDNDGEYWRLTTTDGTQFYFGLGRLPGWSSGKPETMSTFTAPVFGNHAGEPCHQTSGFLYSRCMQGWRWNLDYVVDPHGNTMSYWYTKEQQLTSLNGTASQTVSYDRGGVLSRIEYGTRSGTELTSIPPARVVFTPGDRCESACWSGSNPVAANWPDTPWDLNCTAAPCSNGVAFWTSKRLAGVRTQTWTGGAWRDVDEWTLTHGFPGTSESSVDRVLWLINIGHAGKVGGTATVPLVEFGGQKLPNRADYNLSAGVPQVFKYRITLITSESGGQTRITYEGSDCTAAPFPNPDNNFKRCFPQYYFPPGASSPGWSWWNKYRVTQVLEQDLVGGSPDVVHGYAYATTGSSTGVLWHHDDNVWSQPLAKRSWSDFRGWPRVTVRTGLAGTTQSESHLLYFRGLDQDRTDAGNYTRDAKITNSLGEITEDQSHLAGMLHEQIDYATPGGQALTKTITTPWQQQTALRTMSTTVAIPPIQRAFFTRTAVTRKLIWLAASSSWRTTRVESTFDPTFGQATAVKDLGDIAVTADDACTSTSYARNTSAWLIEFEAQTVVTDCAATPGPANHLGGRRTFYDGSTVVGAAPTRGLATRTDELASFTGLTANWVTAARAEHDALGRHTKTYDALNRFTTIGYTPASAGLVTGLTVTNPAGHVTTSTVETAWGLPLTVVDPNTKTTTAAYDPLGRLLKMWLPGRSTGLTPNAEYAYNLRGTIAASSSTTKRLGPNGNQIVSHEIYDGLLRVRQAQITAPDGKRVISDTAYDSRGLTVKSSGFYNNASGPTDTLVSFTDASIAMQTTRVYDGLARQTASILMSLGVEKWRTSTAYDGDRAAVTPPTGGTATTTLLDANGRAVELRQHHAATPTGTYDATTYLYDRLDRLTRITDPAGNDWDYTYDLRGRKTQTVDPDAGTATMTYDDAGQLLTTVDARPVTLAYAYDSLGRRTAVHKNSVASGPKLTETVYDTVAKGMVTSSTRWHGGQAYVMSVGSYDDGYRPLSTTVTVPAAETGLAGSYAFGATYNVDGSVATQSLPGAGGLAAETLTYGYSTAGLPTTLAGSSTYVGSTAYHFDGQVAQRILGAAGKQVRQSYGLEESTRRLTTIQLDTENQTTPGTWVDRSTTNFGYDNAGNIGALAGKTDGVTDQVECFRYDHLRRLTRAFTNSSWDCGTPVRGGADPYHRSWTYDVTGNRLTQTDHAPGGDVTSTYTYPSPGGVRPHAVSGITGGSTYTYDGAGNTVTRPGGSGQQTLDWADDGGLARVTEGSSVTEFVYDASGTRLVRRDPSGKTLYLPGGMELRSSGDAIRYYSHGGAVAAVRTGSGLSWQHSNHLGTAQASIDSGSLAVSRRRTMPFGEPRGVQPSGWPGDKGYVGGTTDPTGLTHLGAREYDPGTGRFVSVDPVLDVADPQQMNGYAYANNSPVTLSDPSGLLQPDYPGADPPPPPPCFASGSASCPGNGGGPSQPPPPPPPSGPVKKAIDDAKKMAEEGKQLLVEAAKIIGKIAMDELGITAALDCFMNGDIGACAETALNIAMAFVGGIVTKLLRKYGAPWNWKKGVAVAQRLKDAFSKLASGFRKWWDNSRLAQRLARECNSFVPGTLVVLADGSSKPIEEVELGDVVLATDPATGGTSGKTVEALITGSGSKHLVKVSVSTDGDAVADGAVTATEGHPFWVPDLQEWVDAGRLQPGQWLRTSAGTWVQVTAVERWTQPATVHNLTISTLHTYYVLVGATSVLVHNDGSWNPAWGPEPDWDPGTGHEDGDFTPRGNQEQNKAFNDAIQEAQRRIGRPLNSAERRAVHEAITKQGLGYHQIVDEAVNMFGTC